MNKYEKDLIILKCVECGTKVVTKKTDSAGKAITEVLCWNCISGIVEESNSKKFLNNTEGKDREAIRQMGKEKRTAKGLMKRTLNKLANNFMTEDLFEAYLMSKEEVGEAVIRDRRTRQVVVYNYTKYWMKKGLIEKHGRGRSAYYSKIQDSEE